jgi:hypothetical protein
MSRCPAVPGVGFLYVLRRIKNGWIPILRKLFDDNCLRLLWRMIDEQMRSLICKMRRVSLQCGLFPDQRT